MIAPLGPSNLSAAPASLGFVLVSGHSVRSARGGVIVAGPGGQGFLVAPDGVAVALALLDTAPVTTERLREELDRHADIPGELTRALEYLLRAGAVQRVVASEERVLASVEPVGPGYRLGEAGEPRPHDVARLSRFAYLRVVADTSVLESPLCHARIRLHEPALAAVVASCASPSEIQTLVRDSPVARNALYGFVALLASERFITLEGPGADRADGKSTALRQWEFHDLLFHTRSRAGRHHEPLGGTYRFRGEIAPLPRMKPPMSAGHIALEHPDLLMIAARDMTLTEALESRRSERQHGAAPITLAQLGEFLYRTARVRGEILADGVELSNRPYPSGGASYELEVYAIVDRCDGLLAGVYHYAPAAHALEPLSPPSELTELQLFDAWTGTGRNVRPQILFVITARFQRVSWKYASIAYATILKNVGVLYQTMYLVATAMRLAPCAIGAGNSDRFSELIGTEYEVESAVGEFILGSRAP